MADSEKLTFDDVANYALLARDIIHAYGSLYLSKQDLEVLGKISTRGSFVIGGAFSVAAGYTEGGAYKAVNSAISATISTAAGVAGGALGSFIGGPLFGSVAGIGIGVGVGKALDGVDYLGALSPIGKFFTTMLGNVPLNVQDQEWTVSSNTFVGDTEPYTRWDQEKGWVYNGYTGPGTGYDTPSELNAGNRSAALPSASDIPVPSSVVQLGDLPVATPYTLIPSPVINSPLTITPVSPTVSPPAGLSPNDFSGTGSVGNGSGSRGQTGSRDGGKDWGGSSSSSNGTSSSGGGNKSGSGNKSGTGNKSGGGSGYADTPEHGPTPSSRPDTKTSPSPQRDNQDKNYGGWGKRSDTVSPRSPPGECLCSPVLLDLTGSGLSIQSLYSSAEFIDLDGSGYLHRTAWAGEGTGVLVLDADGDGKISRSSEYVFTDWDPSASGDLQAIRNVFDSNGNGKLDVGDERWSEFKVSINGQLKSLDELGIASIDLQPSGSGQTFSDGSAILGTTTFTRTDGTTGAVGDALLVADNNGYKLERTTAANADGSSTELILGYDPGGSLAFRNLVTRSADGRTVFTQFDDDGNGIYDRSQSKVTTVSASGQRTEVVENFNADGSLLNRTETVTSADRKTITTLLDQDGDGLADQRQLFEKLADGSTRTTTQQLSASGAVLQSAVVEASPDGLTKTSTTNVDGDAVNDYSTLDVTTVAADGARQRVVTERARNGATLSRTTISTASSAGTTTTTTLVDVNGNGTDDTKTEERTSVGSTGDVTTEHALYSGAGALFRKEVSVATADGLSKSASVDLNGDGVFDRLSSDVTVVDAAGQTRTSQTKSASGALLSKTITTINAGQTSILSTSDLNGDGSIDVRSELSTAADGSTTKVDTTYNPDGSVIARATTLTSKDGLSITTSTDIDGDGTIDNVTSSVTTPAVAGGMITVGRSVSENGTLLAETRTTTSSDSLSQTSTIDLNGDGVIDTQSSDVITLSADGSRHETIEARGRDGTLLSRTTIDISADRKTSTTLLDKDGDGNVDARLVETILADGSKVTTENLYTPSGVSFQASGTTVNGSGLTTSSTVDYDGDGVSDVTSSDVTVINDNGSTKRTITKTSANGTTLGSASIVTTGNGLSVTSQEDLNGDGVIDLKTVQLNEIKTSGYSTRTTSSYRGSSLISKVEENVKLNDLGGFTKYDLDGNGVIDQVLTTSRTFNANGSVKEESYLKTNSGILLSKTTSLTGADGKSRNLTYDTDGDGVVDRQTSVVVNNNGTTVRTDDRVSVAGTMTSRIVSEVSSTGLTSSWRRDLDSDGSFERSGIDVTLHAEDGSQTRTVTEFDALGVIATKVVYTTSADNLTKMVVWFEGANEVRSSSDVTMINGDGGTTRTIEFRKADGSLESREVRIEHPHNSTSTTTWDINGDGVIDQRFETLLASDGTYVETASDVAAGGLTARQRTVTTSANGLQKTVDYDSDGDGIVDKRVTSNIALNANGSRTTVTRTYVRQTTGLVLDATETTETSADGRSILTQWDTDGSGTVDKNQTDVTTLAADGSTTRIVSYFEASVLESRYKVVTSANGLSITRYSDLTGSGSYTQSQTDVTVLNDDGTRTRSISSLASDGTLLSQTITTESANKEHLQTSEQRAGLETRVVLREHETLADGSVRETVTTRSDTGVLLSKVTTFTSADQLRSTTDIDADGDGLIDQRREDDLSWSGERTSTTTSFGNNGTVEQRSIATEAANGLSSTTSWDLNGDGILDRKRVEVRALHADGSRTISQTDTDLETGTLKSTTTIGVSADGQRTTISKDLDANGTADQVETIVTELTGESRSVVTNNSTARDLKNLPQGAVAWKDAIASTVETTTSLDGQSSIQRYDYDGDGVFETVMRSQQQIDGSTATAITETNAAGATSASGTITTSSDGLVTKLTKDADNNGTIDHVEAAVTHADGSVTMTETEFDANGALSKTVVDQVDAFGALTERVTTDGLGRMTLKTVVDLDGKSVTTGFDPATGQTLSVSRATKAGLLTSVTLYDPLNAQVWSRVEQQFNAAGQKTVEVQYKDDGTRAEISFHVATGKQQQVQYFDATGKLTNVVDFDVTNAAAWSQISKAYNAASQLTSEVVVNDDNTKVQYTYDPTNAQTWSTHQQNLNAAGQLTYVLQTNDNGTKYAVYYDPTNVNAWSRVEYSYDTAGRTTTVVTYQDNGTRVVNTYDPTNAQSWSLYVQTFNTAGSLTQVRQVSDNGSWITVDYDPQNAASWSQIQTQYDSANRPTFQLYNYDSGARAEITFDPTNAQYWTNVTYTYDSSNRLLEQSILQDDGIRVSTYYDVDESQPYSWGVRIYAQNGNVISDHGYTNGGGRSYKNIYDAYNNQTWTRKLEYYVGTEWQYTETWYDNGKYDKVSKPRVIREGSDPVVLDLNGDGAVSILPIAENDVSFDWDGDGIVDPTAWVGPEDGMLVIDLASDGSAGGDGSIDQAREIAFSMWPEDAETNPVSDLEGLRIAFDSNGDNILDSQDARWSEFRIWQDLNQNGISDAGELKTMSEAGVKLINLLPVPDGAMTFADGSAITGTSYFETADGLKHLAADASFRFHPSRTDVAA